MAVKQVVTGLQHLGVNKGIIPPPPLAKQGYNLHTWVTQCHLNVPIHNLVPIHKHGLKRATVKR